MTRSVGRLAVVAALGAMLSGCATTFQNATAPQGGRITWVAHPNYASLMDSYSKAPGKKRMTGKLGAFATQTGLLMEGGTCEIHTLFPGGYPTEHSFGVDMAHEFRHCSEGAFHN